MLQAGSERRLLPAGSMWVPGMSLQQAPYGAASPSARALEIARRRDEMLGMLHGLPESDYELSLTDLVEKTAASGGANAGLPLPPPLPPSPSERKEPIPSPLGRPGWQSEQQPAAKTKPFPSSRRRSESGSGSGSARSSFRSSSDSVLLNFYMPRSITRSFTAPRAGGRGSSVSGPARAAVVPDDSNKRERDSDSVKCWPMMPWDRRWRKSSRRDTAGGEFEAILKN
ncbi:uncharacterized protein [Lolium perenne]|uniref:uncharacterized protein n=1 Tax=Lolium perenne TaxID=4522 RepID=UPI0021EAE628|nr:uncharacterized protein LOC127297270 [Lolium perenne]